MSRRNRTLLFLIRNTNTKQTHKKVLNMSNHQGNVNQKHNVSSFNTCQDNYHQMLTNNIYQTKCEEKTTSVYCWWECKSMKAPQKTVCSFLKKNSFLKIEHAYDLEILLLDIYRPPQNENTNLKRYIHPSVHVTYQCLQ